MDFVLLVGRILFVALFLASAMGHLTQSKAMGAYAGSKGVPSPVLATQVSGVLILLGGISVLLGLWGDLGSLFLVVFLLPTALLMHAFWKETEPMAKQMEMVQFNKDVALAGGALVLFWAFSQDPGMTITNSLF
ncbi:MAG TPA: DoxX family protein [Intrasporangium sp.]|jgi:Predicted membrane protein|uniref:DoxX family protein n=1 Tax=Intrasporangium sp. TaxID=1925024 RepID=UPI002F955D88